MFKEVYLGLGSNLGDRLRNLDKAERTITSLIGPVIKASGIYETTSWGFKSSSNFLNKVINIETGLLPEDLLEKILFIESAMGRVREGKGYTSRIIDIDILFFGNQIINAEFLTIPHPLIAERKFVLVPLFSIAPDFVHPVTGKSIRELLETCTDSGLVIPYNG
jgi:2-amino-4-hydroxy-6-hydroxymethyldihydropteridine diphosphokinase